jgi:hypothetical protein
MLTLILLALLGCSAYSPTAESNGSIFAESSDSLPSTTSRRASAQAALL